LELFAEPGKFFNNPFLYHATPESSSTTPSLP